MSWPTGPNYKTKAVATAKFFFQHFQKVDTSGEDLLTQSQFNEAIKNITEDKSVNGGFDTEPPKWDDVRFCFTKDFFFFKLINVTINIVFDTNFSLN